MLLLSTNRELSMWFCNTNTFTLSSWLRHIFGFRPARHKTGRYELGSRSKLKSTRVVDQTAVFANKRIDFRRRFNDDSVLQVFKRNPNLLRFFARFSGRAYGFIRYIRVADEQSNIRMFREWRDLLVRYFRPVFGLSGERFSLVAEYPRRVCFFNILI